MSAAPAVRRFTPDDVREIRARMERGDGVQMVARAYRCTPAAIRTIAAGHGYKHVDPVERGDGETIEQRVARLEQVVAMLCTRTRKFK